MSKTKKILKSTVKADLRVNVGTPFFFLVSKFIQAGRYNTLKHDRFLFPENTRA